MVYLGLALTSSVIAAEVRTGHPLEHMDAANKRDRVLLTLEVATLTKSCSICVPNTTNAESAARAILGAGCGLDDHEYMVEVDGEYATVLPRDVHLRLLDHEVDILPGDYTLAEFASQLATSLTASDNAADPVVVNLRNPGSGGMTIHVPAFSRKVAARQVLRDATVSPGEQPMAAGNVGIEHRANLIWSYTRVTDGTHVLNVGVLDRTPYPDALDFPPIVVDTISRYNQIQSLMTAAIDQAPLGDDPLELERWSSSLDTLELAAALTILEEPKPVDACE